MKKLAGLLILVVTGIQLCMAQVSFSPENKIYRPEISTVICYNQQKEQSTPVIKLKSAERLIFSFDDLEGGSKNYWYTIEHCTHDWKPSNLSPIDYLESFSDDRIVDYAYSSNTLQKYTHYSLTLPNEQISPKISGNYLLKIYLDGDLNKPVISQRFYVVEDRVNAGLEMLPSMQVPLRTSNQKINVNIFHTAAIQNPAADVKVVVTQNNIPYTAITTTKPSSIKPGELGYKDPYTNDFPAGNEFRKFDIRSLRAKAEHVQEIQRDTINKVLLFTDVATSGKYVRIFDENGNFFIRNQDGRDADTESDYAQVTFSLKAGQNLGNKAIYVVGRFNNYSISPEYKMRYNAASAIYTSSLKLKQGLYDYKYALVDPESGKVNDTALEGSYFETDNSYQVFIYYKKPGSRWEELIGYSQTSR
jgi:hypothetical protein